MYAIVQMRKLTEVLYVKAAEWKLL